jgi:hypothetical protein
LYVTGETEDAVFENELKMFKKIKFRGGIFSVAALVLMILIICVSAVCIRINAWWLILSLMIPMMSIVFYNLKRLMDFAVQNPQAAIMEGAELLQHEKLIHESKLQGRVIETTPTTDHVVPTLANVADPDVDTIVEAGPVGQVGPVDQAGQAGQVGRINDASNNTDSGTTA